MIKFLDSVLSFKFFFLVLGFLALLGVCPALAVIVVFIAACGFVNSTKGSKK